MKKIGIVGGVAWPSTLEYYRLICLGANEHFKRLGASPPYPTPLMTIESLVMNETRKLRGTPGGDDAEWTAFDAVFRGALLRLEQAGCEFGIIANNTSHTRLRTIRQGVTLPIISILEETAKATNASGAAKALVLGTSVTMRSNDYADLLRAHGVEPNSRLPEDTIDEIQRLIDTEFDLEAQS
ncbi:MAG: aspartate/glutamate racemase family protein [Pseudomonadota bacterium]